MTFDLEMMYLGGGVGIEVYRDEDLFAARQENDQ